MKYKLRFITIHEGQGGGFQGNEEGTEDEEASQAHYFGYLCNFATSQWCQIDDEDVEIVEENIVLEDAKDKAYMLHYICCGSEEYNVCYQEDQSLCSYPKKSAMAVPATSTPKSYATPSATRPPETSEKDDSKGLTSKGKDLLMISNFQKRQLLLQLQSQQHIPPRPFTVPTQSVLGPSVPWVAYCQCLSQKISVALKVANWFCITCAKPNGSHINIVWNAPTATQVYLSMIQVERRDASTIILIVNW